MTKRVENSQAGNWTNGDRRGKFFPVRFRTAGAVMPYSPGKIQFEIKLERTIERDEDEDDVEQVLKIELSLEDARRLHEALSHSFLDLVRCDQKVAGLDCASFKGGPYHECAKCEKHKAERAALWDLVKRWDEQK